ncbi:SDR family oxidoreductase [Sphingobium subterraneum]|uniref:NAD(P)-dependent dehydrogenase (Short-subunit alcohol dehydrogenase family) n=1 Tax=Sphingobium subterraneum TaxID=627688 RepID=A0A841J007_9SPHN|nr:SDR family oxidoreductase [Sphingobium subterraneum]MBB6124004.1 NAD(P)-dependent dehydrogenase (short-subunit alcohol dehydrogenase family) [Sphingobium subterraneum]
MAGRIAGKVALVTGAASGLGDAIVRRFHEEGATVVLTDIDEANGTALANELGARTDFLQLDVTSEENWIAVFAAIASRHGRLDVLVNCAGITTYGSVEEVTLDAFRHEMDVDLVGPFLGCKHVVPLMRKTGGSVINISSMASIRAEHYLVAYNAAKAGVTHMTKSVALHYARAGYGMRCNSVHPGVIHTPILDKVLAQAEDPDALYAEWLALHPIGRIGKPEEVAALCLYLASDESAFATGAEFVLDGGSSL